MTIATSPAPSLVRDPRIPSNLAGITSVRIKCDTTAVLVPGFSENKIKRAIKSLLDDFNVAVDPKSFSTLIISAETEPRPSHKSVVYAVEVSLREPVYLIRNGKMSVTGRADVWRHQAVTGFVTIPFDEELLGKALSREVLRQVNVFINDVATQIPRHEIPTVPPRDPVKDPTDAKFLKIKQRLEELLRPLAVGNDGSVTIDKFEVSGNQVSFHAIIRHRQVHTVHVPAIGDKTVVLWDLSTGVEGDFDITNPASLKSIKIEIPTIAGGGTRTISLKDLEELFT
ncbi:MAG: hypothetical protein U0903_01375 [Planctomycetales bacterium]